MLEPDHYATLGVDADATPAEIRAAFRRLVRQRHPDTSWGASDDAAARDVIAAYRVVGDPEARARYDIARRQRDGPATAPVARNRTRRVRCAMCGGLGRVATEVTCAACGGHAEVTVVEHRAAHVERCNRCAGRGRSPASLACPHCGGSGVTGSGG